MSGKYAQQWVDSGYLKGMGSASFLPPPPKHLFRLYHFTSREHAINDICNRRLKVARFSDANDPFELICLNLREKSVRQAVKDFKIARNAETGLLCFTKDWTNPLLWSHYANSHAGICLGFNLNRECIHEVTYEPERLPKKLGQKAGPFTIDENVEKRLLLTKSYHWKYEDEFRRFIELSNATKEGELYFQPFDEHMQLAEVILGPRCGEKLEKVVEVTSATNPLAIVFRARLEFGGFRVIRNGWDLPRIEKALAEIQNRY